MIQKIREQENVEENKKYNRAHAKACALDV